MGGSFYLAATAFLLGLLLTPLLRDWFAGLGLLDRPDSARKLHARAVPRLGGVAIALAFCSALAVFRFPPALEIPELRGALAEIAPLAPGALLVFLAGVADDIWDLRPWQKLTVQAGAAAWVAAAGLRVDGVAGRSLAEMPWLTFPLTVLWLVACTNAFNLIDGVDGLAAGVGFFATVTIFLSAALKGDAQLQLLVAPLAGALLAFLRYNFNPATMFLGDSGSMLIGFLLGGFSIIWSHKSATILGMTAPVFALAFPIAETAISFLRRWLRGESVFAADRGHMHHRLLEMGLGPRQVALLLYAVTGVGAAVSLIVSTAEVRQRAAVVLLFCVFAWFAFQRLGYAEFASARRLLLGKGIREWVTADLQTRAFAERVLGGRTFEACWATACEGLPGLGFCGLRVEGGGGRRCWGTEEGWAAVVELRGGGRLTLWRRFGAEPGHAVEPVLGALREAFEGVGAP